MAYSKKILITTIITAVVILTVNPVQAEESISLRTAVELGLKNNQEIINAVQQRNQLQRELKIIKANSDWQLRTDFESSSSHFNDRILNAGDNEDNTQHQLDLALEAEKNYWSGLTINPEIYWSEDDLSSDLRQEPEFRLSLTQDLYPSLAVTNEQNYVQQQLELEYAQAELEQKKNSKIITWVNDYLAVLRRQENYQLAQQRYKLAEQELEDVIAQKKINEAGEIEVLKVKSELKEAESQLQSARTDYQNSKQDLYNQLDLSDEHKLVIDEDTSYLKTLQSQVKSNDLQLDKQDRLLELARADNLELLQNKIKQASTENEVQWQQLEQKADVNFLGSYDTKEEEVQAGISINYNFYDSGQSDLELENLTEELATIKQEKSSILKEIKLELQQLIDEVENRRINLERAEYSYERAQLAEQIAQKQLEQGSINQLEFKDKKIAYQVAGVELKEAQDELLVSKLELLDYLGTNFLNIN